MNHEIADLNSLILTRQAYHECYNYINWGNLNEKGNKVMNRKFITKIE